jgi:hypothetical protein
MPDKQPHGHDPRTDAARAAAFVSDDVIHVPHVSRTRERDTELRAWIAMRVRTLDTSQASGTPLLLPHATFYDWSRIAPHAHTSPLTIGQWRATRAHDHVLDTLRRATRDVHTLTRCDTRTITLTDGTIVHTDTRDERATCERIARGFLAARRAARGLRRSTLRNRYWGTLTEDGATVATIHARRSPLDVAIALSDTFVTRDGVTVPRLSRGIRTDAGTFDGESTLNARRFVHARKGL